MSERFVSLELQREALLGEVEQAGRLIAKLEDMLFGEDEVNPEMVRQTLEQSGAGNELKKSCWETFERFQATLATAKTIDASFAGIYAERGVEDSAETRGRWVFDAMASHPPLGEVRFSLHGGYGILIIKNPHDYKSLHDEFDGPRSGGRFHRGVELHVGDAAISVLVLEDTSEQLLHDAVIHERQHWVNHELAGILESTNVEPDPRMRAIKDEIIAYTRQGVLGSEAIHEIQGELYAHLWSEFAPDERRQVEEVLDQLGQELNGTVADFGSSVTMGMLMVTPLKKAAKRFAALRPQRQPVEVL